MYGGAVYGQGSGPIWLAEVKCEGTEDRIYDCYHDAWGVKYCDHSKDVSITCLLHNCKILVTYVNFNFKFKKSF